MGVNNIKGLRVGVQPQTPERLPRAEARADPGERKSADQKKEKDSDFRQQHAPPGLLKASQLASSLSKIRSAAMLVKQFALDLKVQTPQLFGSPVLTHAQKAQRALEFLSPYAQHLATLVPAGAREQPAAAMLAVLEETHVFDQLTSSAEGAPRDVAVVMLTAETPEEVQVALDGVPLAEPAAAPVTTNRATITAEPEEDEPTRRRRGGSGGVLVWVRGIIDQRKDVERGPNDWTDRLLIAAGIAIIALGFAVVALLTVFR